MKETLLRVETDERSHIEDSEMVPCAVDSVFLVHSERSIKGVEPYISASCSMRTVAMCLLQVTYANTQGGGGLIQASMR